MANFGNLDWTDGNVSVPGIYHVLYFIEKSNITAWPTFAAVPSSASEEVTYVGDFTLAVDQVWKEIDCIDIKTEVTSEAQGEIRSVSSNNKLTIKSSLTSEEATAFAKLGNNTDLIYIFREKNSGKYRVCGSEMFVTFTRTTLQVGSDPTGERGVTIEVESTDFMPFPFYDGAIVTEDGDQNPSA